MELPFFGTLDLDNLEELYEFELELNNQQNCDLAIWFENEDISVDQMEPVSNVLEKLKDLIKDANEFLFDKEEGRKCLVEYIENQAEVLDKSKKEYFEILETDNLETQHSKIEKKVYLKGITIFPENDDSYEIMRMDYSVGDFTDYIICIDFDFYLSISGAEIRD